MEAAGEAEVVEVVAVELEAFVEGVAQGAVEVLQEGVDEPVVLGAEEGRRSRCCNFDRALLVCCHYGGFWFLTGEQSIISFWSKRLEIQRVTENYTTTAGICTTT